MKTGEIRYLCDCCNEDLTYTGWDAGYIIKLTNQAQQPYGGASYSGTNGTPIKDKHFCNMECAKNWFAKENEE